MWNKEAIIYMYCQNMHILVKYFDFHMIESYVQKKTWQGCRGGEIDEISTKNVFFVESFV